MAFDLHKFLNEPWLKVAVGLFLFWFYGSLDNVAMINAIRSSLSWLNIVTDPCILHGLASYSGVVKCI